MSGTMAPADKPRLMREVPMPELPQSLRESVPEWIANGPDTLAEVRTAAFEALLDTGLPHSGSEDFTFIRVGEFLPHMGPPGSVTPMAGMPAPEAIAPLILPESRDCFAVLVDGRYIPELSRPGKEYSLAPLSRTRGGLDAEAYSALIRMAREETDAAAALAMVFAPEPLVIRLAAESVPAAPLLLLHLRSASASGQETRDRIDTFVVYSGIRHSEGMVLVRHAVLAPPSRESDGGWADAGAATGAVMENLHTLALLDPEASLKFLEAGSGDMADSQDRNVSTARDIHFRKLSARLDRGSRLQAVSAHTGSRLTRNGFSVDLAGEGAEGEINGAAVLTGNRQSHNFLRIRHLVPNCASRQHFKSVAADQSRSSVDGTIHVSPGAQQTNAYQLINNLMLSDEARTDSKPRLMIFADDVKCTHGATTGMLDPAQQFYLESRGLPPAKARALLTVAFIAEILEKAGKTGEPGALPSGGSGNFRDFLDHALLDTLKHRLPSGAEGDGNA